MKNIYKLFLSIVVLGITVGCEYKCDEDDFIGFKMTQDKFFNTTKIFATKITTEGYVDNIETSETVTIVAYGNKLTVSPKKPVLPSISATETAGTKFLPAWNFQLFNIENAYPADYEIACGLELCCYSCAGIEKMFFDESGVFNAKIDNTNINQIGRAHV